MRPAVKNAVIADQYRKSLYHLCKYGLGMKDVNRACHGGMIANLESETQRKLIVMPRGHLKSSIGIVGYCIWRLIKNPNERILIDSEVYVNSSNFLREIKAHLENPRLTEIFGEFKSKPWSEGELTIAQRTHPYKEASITCGGVNTVKVGQHMDVILADDLNSSNNSGTIEARAKVYNHYRMNISILEPTGTYVVIGTRYSSSDVIGEILKNLGIK